MHVNHVSQLCSPVETRRQLLREVTYPIQAIIITLCYATFIFILTLLIATYRSNTHIHTHTHTCTVPQAFCFHCECERCVSEEIESKTELESKQGRGGRDDSDSEVEALEERVQYFVNHMSSSKPSSPPPISSSYAGESGQQQPSFQALLDQADSQMQQFLSTRKHGSVGDIASLTRGSGSVETGGSGPVIRGCRALYAVHDAALLVVNHALHQRLNIRKTTAASASTSTPLGKGQLNDKVVQIGINDHDNDLLLVRGAWLVHEVRAPLYTAPALRTVLISLLTMFHGI